MREKKFVSIIFIVWSICFMLCASTQVNAAAKTWDGGGATNNWSEAANWSGDTVPAAGDDVTFDATSTKNAVIDVNINVGSIQISSGYTGTVTQSNTASVQVNGCSGRPCFRQDSGTFVGSSNTITLNNLGSGGLTMNGGIFNGGSGNVSLTGSPADFSLQGGTFTSTSGNLTTSGNLRFQGTSVFQPGSGTVTVGVINSFSFMATDANHTSVTFNNLAFNNADGANFDIGPRVIVTGNLSLNDGSVGPNGSAIEARSGLSLSPNFDGGVVALELANGSGPRNITLGTNLRLPKFVVNDPNVTINTSGAGALTFPHQLILNAGVFNQANDLIINAAGVGGFCYIQTGGTFNGSGNMITLNSEGFGAIRINGGTFNGGSGNITVTGTGDSVNLQGGTFRSTSGNLIAPGTFRFQGVGTTFLHNNGTVTFTVTQNDFLTNDGNHPTINFNNLNFNLANGVNYDFGPRVIAEGTLALNDGRYGQGGNGSILEARGNVLVGPNFDGAGSNSQFIFGGGVNQTFTNNGGINPQGTWTVNKTSGIITAVTNVILQPTQQLNITSGTLYLGNGSSLVTGPIALSINGRLLADSAQTITLGGDVVNSGTINLHANGTACPTADSILIRSSIDGTRRNWSGSGVFRAVNADVKDMGGTASIKVFNGTNSGNNSANWSFDNSCLANVIHTPFDFDGDHKTDIAMFRPSSGNWFLNRSTLGVTEQILGISTDKITPADFDGDGITDIAVWRPGTQSKFLILQSASATLRMDDFGIAADDPKPVADWDGDGIADPAVYRTGAVGNQNFFFFLGSRNNPNRNITFIPWGSNTTGDRPARGDFDGDGKADAAIFRPTDGNWWIFRSSNGQAQVLNWGLAIDRIVDGDFDGDGKTDLAVFRNSDTNWYILQSSNGQPRFQQWGVATDKLVPGDYDGDGKTDVAIWRPPDGTTWILFSSTGGLTAIPFGLSSDIPAASAYEP